MLRAVLGCAAPSPPCPALCHPQGCAGQCHFGPRCRFLHDVSEYLAGKPADLGQRCVLFDTFGRCPYGVTCRFGQAHLGDGHQNLVNAALAQQWEGKLLVRNSLSKDLQQQLRKRKFSFQKAEEFLRGLRGGKGGKAAGGSTEVSNCTAPREGLGDSPVLQEQGEDPKPEALQSSQGAEDAPKPEALQSSRGAEDAPSIPTLGPLTDEDVTKLRPCEKKKVRVPCVPIPWWRLGVERWKRNPLESL